MFLTQLGYGIITPFLTLYFGQYVSIESIALILAGTYGVSILANLFAAKIIERLHSQRTLTYALAGAGLAVAVVGFAGHIVGAVMFFSTYTFLLAVALFNVDLYIRHYSDSASLGGNEGKLGVFGNLGWLVGPIIGGFIGTQFGLSAVFIACAIATFIGLILFVEIRPHDREFRSPTSGSFKNAFKAYMRDSEMRRFYIISFGLAFVYASWSFVPLLLTSHGLAIGTLGIVYGLSALPWVLFEYPIGRLAGRGQNERLWIATGFALIVAALIGYSLLDSVTWLICSLFIGITGSSFIERTHVTAFFRHISEGDVEVISVWRTSTGLAYIISPLIAALLLNFVTLEFYYLLVAIISLMFIAVSLSLRPGK